MLSRKTVSISLFAQWFSVSPTALAWEPGIQGKQMIITVAKSIRINENINLWLATWFLGLMILNSVRLVYSNGNGQLHYGRFPNALETNKRYSLPQITKPFCKYVARQYITKSFILLFQPIKSGHSN